MNILSLPTCSFIRKDFVRLIATLFISTLALVGVARTNTVYGASNPNARPLKIYTFSASHHTEQYVRVTDMAGKTILVTCQHIGGSDSHNWINLENPVDVNVGVYLIYYDGTGSGDHCSESRKLLKVKIQFKSNRLRSDTTTDPYCYFDPDPYHDDTPPQPDLSGCVSSSLTLPIQFFSLGYGPNSTATPPPDGTRPFKVYSFSSSHHTEQYVRMTDLSGKNVLIDCQHTGGSDSHTWYNLIKPVNVGAGVLLTYYDGTSGGNYCADQNKLLSVKIQFKPSRLRTDTTTDPYCYFDPDPYHDNTPPSADLSGCVSSSLTLPVQFFTPK